MMNYIKKLFGKNEKSVSAEPSELDTFIDVSLHLNKDFSIGINLSLDDNVKNKTLSEVEYALVYAEFLNIIMSGKLQMQLIDIIITQIKNSNNENFINSILGFLVLMEQKTKNIEKNEDDPLIKPSQVFSRYKNGQI